MGANQLDAVRMKGGESCLDQGGEEFPVGARKHGPGDGNRRDGAPRGARALDERARYLTTMVAPLGAPSPRFRAGEKCAPRRRGGYGAPGAANNTGDDARPLSVIPGRPP